MAVEPVVRDIKRALREDREVYLLRTRLGDLVRYRVIGAKRTPGASRGVDVKVVTTDEYGHPWNPWMTVLAELGDEIEIE